MATRATRALLVAGLCCLAVGAFAGVGAAVEDPTDGTTIDLGFTADAGEGGGDGEVVCTGAVTDHDCDKGGELAAGPAGIEYDGFNDDSLEERSSAFGDTVVVTAGEESATVGFTCDVGLEAPDGNPCPVEAPGGSLPQP